MKRWVILLLVNILFLFISNQEKFHSSILNTSVSYIYLPIALKNWPLTPLGLDLDQPASRWVMTIDPPGHNLNAEHSNIANPSLDGTALRLKLNNGDSYTGPHFYTVIQPMPRSAYAFELSLFYRFSNTTWSNCLAPSSVQALEFVVGKRVDHVWWEWAVQWMNVGPNANGCDGVPRWRIWNDSHSWDDIGLAQKLTPNEWHHLVFRGEIKNGQVYYSNLESDGVFVQINNGFSPAIEEFAPDEVAVAVQLDGNYQDDSYEVIVDKIELRGFPADIP